MLLETLKKELMIDFPEVELARIFFMKQNIILEEKYGFIPENTHFAEGGCSDEINEQEYLMMERYWGERFKFGGLAGYCHGGRTSFKAVSHHVPEVSGKKNLLFVTGPHIGYHDGQWGKIPRKGLSDLTSSCSALTAIVNKELGELLHEPMDILDQQQYTVERIMIPYIKACEKNDETPNILDATKFLTRKTDADVRVIIEGLNPEFDGQIALITGITINTELGNFFSPSLTDVLGRS